MNWLELIPPFDFQRVVVEPWTLHRDIFLWIFLMGFFVTLGCGLVGKFMILRRMSLIGDAISHSVLPGIAVAFLLSQSRETGPLFIGALGAGFLTSALIEFIHRRTRVKSDAAIGIVFSTLFAIGVILITVFSEQVDLDADCVLHGEIGLLPLEERLMIGGVDIGPLELTRMALVSLAIIGLIALFYKQLLLSSFDPGLAFLSGARPAVAHWGLMAALSIVVVSAFYAVGAILVIAMLIFPGATAALLSNRLPRILLLIGLLALLTSLLGLHLGIWLNASIAASMVVAAGGLFVAAWVLSPERGLWRLAFRLPLAKPTADELS
jgi:manganese/zinc/iron transport system permease protein